MRWWDRCCGARRRWRRARLRRARVSHGVQQQRARPARRCFTSICTCWLAGPQLAARVTRRTSQGGLKTALRLDNSAGSSVQVADDRHVHALAAGRRRGAAARRACRRARAPSTSWARLSPTITDSRASTPACAAAPPRRCSGAASGSRARPTTPRPRSARPARSAPGTTSSERCELEIRPILSRRAASSRSTPRHVVVEMKVVARAPTRRTSRGRTRPAPRRCRPCPR